MDWRPREFNSPPDVVCNWVLEEGMIDYDVIDLGFVVDALCQGYCLQVHCDGGYRDGRGAASFVVHRVDPATGVMERIGYNGIFRPTARSAFSGRVNCPWHCD